MNTDHLTSDAWPPALVRWVRADRALDAATRREQLAPEAELVSPLTDGFMFRGPDQVMGVLESAFDFLQDVEIAGVTGSGNVWALHGTSTLHGNNLEEIQWLEFDESGLIRRITLFIRPVPAAVSLLATIGAPLADRGVLRKPARVASMAAAPLALLLRLSERFVMPRLGRS